MNLKNYGQQLTGLNMQLVLILGLQDLQVAIGAIGIEPGDEVICSPYSMSASATVAFMYGGIPLFCRFRNRYLRHRSKID